MLSQESSAPESSAGSESPAERPRRRGFTLLELVVALSVVALLTMIAAPAYRAQINRSRVSQAIGDIKLIEMKLERYQTDRGRLPSTLTEAGLTLLDPWGRAYRYLVMEGASVGQVRKDHSLHPLNTDYDLYSMGADGQSATPLTAAKSRDDVIRARNGSFVGLATNY